MGSVDASISDLVTIIVKAPNQQIADQTIQCNLSWTIKRLKDYLSEVYPSKPKMEEQKLIYSGKLLIDSAVLKDVLRTYEGQENHTVHLVCTSKAQKFNKSAFNSNITTTINENTTDSGSTPRSGLNSIPNTDSVPVSGSRAQFFDQFTTNQFPGNFDPRYFWPSATPFANGNDVDYNQQYAYMQQAYAQYLSQYMQMMGQPGLAYMTSPIPQPFHTSQMGIPPNNGLPNDRINQERNGPRENQPVAGGVLNDGEDEDGRANRDWLDWFYIFSRIMILFSIVYLYSTPLRLLAVLLLVCVFYLYQNIQTMRVQNNNLQADVRNVGLENRNGDANVNNNNNDNVINHNNQINANETQQQAQHAVNGEDNDGLRRRVIADAPRTHRSADDTNSTQRTTESATIPVPERPSPLAVTLLAIRTFFLSLVPDHPLL